MKPPSSRGTENEAEGLREPLPLLLLGCELPAAGSGERVEASAAIVVGDAPLRGYPAARLETVQGGIERAVVDAERAAGRRLDGLCELPAVGRSGLQQLEHDQVERALEEVDFAAHGDSSWRRIGDRMRF